MVEEALVRGSAISAATLAEVLSILGGADDDPATTFDALRRQGLFGARLAIEPVTEQDAITIASLRPRTRTAGLSLGDRACLALALRLHLPAMTADRAWSRLKVGARIVTIR